jgi:hypothetical protein
LDVIKNYLKDENAEEYRETIVDALKKRYESFEKFEKTLSQYDKLKRLFKKKPKFMQSVFEFYKNFKEDESTLQTPLWDLHSGNVGTRGDKVLCFDCIWHGAAYHLKRGGKTDDLGRVNRGKKNKYFGKKRLAELQKKTRLTKGQQKDERMLRDSEVIEDMRKSSEEGKAYLVKGIKWETDGKRVNLPERLTIVVPNDVVGYSETEQYISDAISNKTGFLHKGFNTVPEISDDEKLAKGGGMSKLTKQQRQELKGMGIDPDEIERQEEMYRNLDEPIYVSSRAETSEEFEQIGGYAKGGVIGFLNTKLSFRQLFD